jgi:hypothetical protein
MEVHMNSPPDSGAPVAALPAWATLALAAIGIVVLWLVSFDNGQLTSVVDSSSTYLHEFFHDSRHVLGVPCH